MSESVTPDGWLRPAPPQMLEGSDRFSGLDATVGDFWRWAFWDLRENTMRGVLAEFLVAAALGRTGSRRISWANHDVTTASGRRVEVKSSGHLQSWAQARHSRLNFGRVAARTWDDRTNELGAEPEVRADVFVFAVHTCTEPAAYDVLDTGQWEFYVVDAEHVRECGYRSVTIAWVRRHASPVAYDQLAATIEATGRPEPGTAPGAP